MNLLLRADYLLNAEVLQPEPPIVKWKREKKLKLAKLYIDYAFEVMKYYTGDLLAGFKAEQLKLEFNMIRHQKWCDNSKLKGITVSVGGVNENNNM